MVTLTAERDSLAEDLRDEKQRGLALLADAKEWQTQLAKVEADLSYTKAERDAIAKDAARYRWLREMHDNDDGVSIWHVRDYAGQPAAVVNFTHHNIGFMIEKNGLDAAIDAAMEQTK